jgi:hypothetical protein
MYPIKLCEPINRPCCIKADKIFYPKERTAVYQGKDFGNQRLDLSPIVISCGQLEINADIEELAYYQWTLEKIRRIGFAYEKFLFDDGKGCRINGLDFETLLGLDVEARQARIARLTTMEFVKLYNRIKFDWDVSLSGDTIYFYRSFFGKYFIGEGRHRVSILYFLNKHVKKNHDFCFVIDKSYIKIPYFYYKNKAWLRRVIKSRFTNKSA